MLSTYSGGYLAGGRGGSCPPNILGVFGIKRPLGIPGGQSLFSTCPPNIFLADTPLSCRISSELFRWVRFVLGPRPLLTEFGNYHILESCRQEFQCEKDHCGKRSFTNIASEFTTSFVTPCLLQSFNLTAWMESFWDVDDDIPPLYQLCKQTIYAEATSIIYLSPPCNAKAYSMDIQSNCYYNTLLVVYN